MLLLAGLHQVCKAIRLNTYRKCNVYCLFVTNVYVRGTAQSVSFQGKGLGMDVWLCLQGSDS
jgi:hypothetical protein